MPVVRNAFLRCLFLRWKGCSCIYQGYHQINKLASIYGRNNAVKALKEWAEEGLLRYIDGAAVHCLHPSGYNFAHGKVNERLDEECILAVFACQHFRRHTVQHLF